MQRTPRTTFLKASLTTFGALALVGSSFAGTAFATGRDEAPGPASKADAALARDHDGDADRSTATRYTEDDDTNDGGTRNNVVDDGDNRHPSGKDRSVEHGRSGNQGNAESDPDDDGRGPDRSNGGADKPNGTGGIDKADQDGNNGCGNDDDFEDDNEGWCGHKPHQTPAAKPTTVKAAATTKPGTDHGTGQDSVQAEYESCPTGMVDVNGTESAGCVLPGVLGAEEVALAAPATVEATPAGEVLGNSAVAAPAEVSPTVRAESAGRPAVLAAALGGVSGALAFTGLETLPLLLVALATIALGWALVRADRKRQAA